MFINNYCLFYTLPRRLVLEASAHAVKASSYPNKSTPL